MVDIVQQVSTDIVLSDKSEAEAGTNNTKFMTPLRTKEAIDKNLVPFNAMSQSQFEAIRAANNEEFAASGFVHFGKHDSTSSRNPINQGLWTLETVSNVLLMGRSQSPHGSSKSKSEGAIINVAGVLFELVNDPIASVKQFTIKFPQAPDGKTTYNKSTGAIVTHVDSTTAFAAQQADPTNVEVVIDRVDMWGFETWLEEVNTTNPYIYPNGLIQSQAPTMDGITTSASARPVTYYAVFDGDTGSKGKGVNFFTLTDAQKKKVLGNHKNNLYYLDDGRLVQWRLRQRTAAGAGNGDWTTVDPVVNVANPVFSSVARMSVQGMLNSVTSSLVTSSSAHYYGASATNSLTTHQAGLVRPYSNGQATAAGVNGECYFLVCGTVNRLNQGAYHPSFNPSGTRKWQHTSGDTSQFWYEPSAPMGLVQFDCFRDGTSINGSAGKGYRNNTGYIGGVGSGRPDGRFYDAIYADGFGGVCRDMRYSAYGLTPTDFAEADQRVKNGTYRGFEKVVFMKLATFTQETAFYGKFAYDDGSGLVGCSSLNIPFISTGTQALASNPYCRPLGICSTRNGRIYSSSGTTASGTLYGNGPSSVDGFSNGDKILVPFFTTSSIGGSFLQTDIIGSPSNILATPQLANGWQGSWIPVIPTGAAQEIPYTRKLIGSGYGENKSSWVYTTNNGSSWASASSGIGMDTVKNAVTGTFAANIVSLFEYQAFAKQTKPSANAVVYGGQSGVGGVCGSSSSRSVYGALLGESLTGLIQKHNQIDTAYIDRLLIDNDAGGVIAKFSDKSPEHVTLRILSPANGSSAVKSLNYNVAVNQQGFINYAYTELKHNGTNWGDDSKVTIVDNQSTKTDLNGNTVLVGTAQLNEPIGWIKLKV